MLPSRVMMVRRAQLVILLVASLLLGAAQCLASCTADGVKSGVPPCHQKTPSHSTPGHQTIACVQDFVVPNAHVAAHGLIAGLVVTPFEPKSGLMGAEAELRPALSPPALLLSAPNVLRL